MNTVKQERSKQAPWVTVVFDAATEIAGSFCGGTKNYSEQCCSFGMLSLLRCW